MSCRTSPSGLSTRSVTWTDPKAAPNPARRGRTVTQATEDGDKAGTDGHTGNGGRRQGGGRTGSGCPPGHRFTRSPRHRSALRTGVGGNTFKQMWCPAGHRFTVPNGPADDGCPQDEARMVQQATGDYVFCPLPHYRTKTGTVVIIFAVIIQTKSQNLLRYEKTYTKATLSGIKKLLFHYHRPRKRLSEECRP